MSELTKDEIRGIVREEYGKVARRGASCCTTGCGGAGAEASARLGYSAEEMLAVPEGSNLGLGCGNPQAIASLREGETVLDLGAGGGFDCFLAARQVGPTGHVIGVDMTPDMVTRARENGRKLATTNVEFRLGEIEHLPVSDGTIDVILSNCVINLSPDKAAVFREALRVLKPGGRLAIADVAKLGALPAAIDGDPQALTGCVSGAETVSEIGALLSDAGFDQIEITPHPASREFIRDWLPGSGVEDHVVSVTIQATKPGSRSCCGPACCSPGGSA